MAVTAAAIRKPTSHHLPPPPPPTPSPPLVEFEEPAGAGGSVMLAAAQLIIVLALVAIAMSHARRQLPNHGRWLKQWAVRLGVARQHRRVATSDSMEEEGRGAHEVAEEEGEEDEEWAEVTREDEGTRILDEESEPDILAIEAQAQIASPAERDLREKMASEPAVTGSNDVADELPAVEERDALPAVHLPAVEAPAPETGAAVSFSARRAPKGNVRFSLPIAEPSSTTVPNQHSPGTPTLAQAVSNSRELLLQRPDAAIALQMDD